MGDLRKGINFALEVLFANNKMKTVGRWSLTALLLVVAWLFFWLWHPEWMSFQEQNQLFLWTTDYLLQRISVAGGLADWLGEFVVQFFYVEWLGALLMALLLVLMQRAGLMALILHPSSPTLNSSLFTLISSLFTLLLPLFFLWLLGDENVLVALPVAVVLVLAAVALMRRTRWYWWLAIVPCGRAVDHLLSHAAAGACPRRLEQGQMGAVEAGLPDSS